MRIVLFLGVLALWTNGFGQTMTGNLKEYLSSYLNGIPTSTSNQYLVPSEQELDLWKTASSHLLNGELGQARTLFDALNYQVIEFTDTSVEPALIHYLLEEKEIKQFFGGSYVLTNNNYCSEFVTIQAPHPLFDANTGLQAVHCFSSISSGLLMLAGTHRCNSNLSSSCDGTTSACGSSEPYRESDLAHTEQSFFQGMTEVVAEYHPTSIFVQLHGFSKQETDPYVILSNGTRTTPSIDYAGKLRDELEIIDPTLTFRLAHINPSWNRLIGFTNTQGRYLNNSQDPCNEEASVGSGRFIHIEQERGKLRENVEGWEKLALAIGRTFNCQITTSTDFNRVENTIYPTPSTTGIIRIKGKNLTRIDLYNYTGAAIRSWKWIHNTKEALLDLSALNSGLYLLKVEDQGITTNHKIILGPK